MTLSQLSISSVMLSILLLTTPSHLFCRPKEPDTKQQVVPEIQLRQDLALFGDETDKNIMIAANLIQAILETSLLSKTEHCQKAAAFFEKIQQCCKWPYFKNHVDIEAKIFTPLCEAVKILRDNKTSKFSKRAKLIVLLDSLNRTVVAERRRLNGAASASPELQIPDAVTMTVDWNSFKIALEDISIVEKFKEFMLNHGTRLAQLTLTVVCTGIALRWYRKDTSGNIGEKVNAVADDIATLQSMLCGPPSQEKITKWFEGLEELSDPKREKYNPQLFLKKLKKFRAIFKATTEQSYHDILETIDEALRKRPFYETTDHKANLALIKTAVLEKETELEDLRKRATLGHLNELGDDLKKTSTAVRELGTELTADFKTTTEAARTHADELKRDLKATKGALLGQPLTPTILQGLVDTLPTKTTYSSFYQYVAILRDTLVDIATLNDPLTLQHVITTIGKEIEEMSRSKSETYFQEAGGRVKSAFDAITQQNKNGLKMQDVYIGGFMEKASGVTRSIRNSPWVGFS